MNNRLMNVVLAGGVSLLCLTGVGCRSARLAEHPDAVLSAYITEGPALPPGGRSPLVVVAKVKDGPMIKTRGAGEGTLSWSHLSVMGQGFTCEDGVIQMNDDPRQLPFDKVRVEVISRENPRLSTFLDIPLRYDTQYVADFSGAHGRPGADGMDGRDGSKGLSGMLNPSHPVPGGNGEDGHDGWHGDDATPGESGKAVRVWATMHPVHKPLMQVKVASGVRERYYLLDPRRGALLVSSNGGNGALGGRGGKGGRGGAGGEGRPYGLDGLPGRQGRDGMGSRGGDGGTITLSIDPNAKEYVGAITFCHRGGQPSGYDGPRPEVFEQPVPPLW